MPLARTHHIPSHTISPSDLFSEQHFVQNNVFGTLINTLDAIIFAGLKFLLLFYVYIGAFNPTIQGRLQYRRHILGGFHLEAAHLREDIWMHTLIMMRSY